MKTAWVGHKLACIYEKTAMHMSTWHRMTFYMPVSQHR